MNLLTPKEVARMLSLSEKSLLQCRSMGLRFVKVTRGAIRYREEDVAEYIEQQTVKPCHSEKRTANTGTMTSKSEVVDFMDRVERKTSKKRKR